MVRDCSRITEDSELVAVRIAGLFNGLSFRNSWLDNLDAGVMRSDLFGGLSRPQLKQI